MRTRLAKWLTAARSKAGQGLVEYALILTLVAVLVMIALAKLSDPTDSPVVELGQTFEEVNS